MYKINKNKKTDVFKIKCLYVRLINIKGVGYLSFKKDSFKQVFANGKSDYPCPAACIIMQRQNV